MEYKSNQEISYDNGIIKGNGLIKGIATIECPVIGKGYIVEDLSNNLPNETYKYNNFVCFENQIKQL